MKVSSMLEHCRDNFEIVLIEELKCYKLKLSDVDYHNGVLYLCRGEEYEDKNRICE